MYALWTDVIKPTIENNFLKGATKVKRWLFQGQNFVIIEAWRQWFSLIQRNSQFVTKKSIFTTDEAPRGTSHLGEILPSVHEKNISLEWNTFHPS